MPDTNLTDPMGSPRHARGMKRPPLPVRIAILVAALALLGLAMCARSKPPAQPAANPPTQAPSAEDNGGSGTPQKVEEEGDMSKRKPNHFPATKAPGPIY